jgi:hypothetical protein
MPITIAKDAASGPSDDTTYTLNNFLNLGIRTDMLVNQIPDLGSDEEAAILAADLAPTMNLQMTWTIADETSTVVSGLGSPVTSAIEQLNYLHTVFRPSGESQITDSYTLVILADSTALNTGTASSGTSTTLVDTGIGWTADAYVMNLLHITGGTGSGQYRTILDNTTDTLTVTRAFDTNPDGTSTYEILNAFARTGRLANIETTMNSHEPLTFQGQLNFAVGTVA